MRWEVDAARMRRLAEDMQRRARDVDARARKAVTHVAEVSATPKRYYLHSDGAVEHLDDYDNETSALTAFGAPVTDAQAIEVYKAARRAGMPQMRALREAEGVLERKRGNVMWVEPDEDDEVQVFRGFEPRLPAKPMCSSFVCRCGAPEKRRCTWWKARHSAHQNTTDVDVIAQQLWQESRELLAKVDVELPSSPPPPVRPVRWYRHPLVKRFGWFGAVPALVFLVLFYALSGELLFGGPTVAFLWGAFVTYEMTARTDARGIRVTSRLKARHLVARVLAIAAFSLLIGWLT